MSPHAVLHVAVQHAPASAAGTPGGLSVAQYAVLGGCVVLLGLIGLLGLLTTSGRSGMATPRAARRLIGETGLRRAAGQSRPSRLEPDPRTHQQAVPGQRGPGRGDTPQKSAPAGGGREAVMTGTTSPGTTSPGTTSAGKTSAGTVRTIKVGGRAQPCTEFGYSLGVSVRPRGVYLWSRGDRSTRVIGPPGSGKTTRLLAPALRDAPGAVLATSTKADLYELTVGARRREDRPVVLCDLGALISGPSARGAAVQPLRWSPITGAADSRVAEKRARAFCAATRTSGPVASASEGAAWYKDRAGMLLACLLHAAALDGADLDQLLAWVRDPTEAALTRILGTDPDAAPGWADVHREAVTGDSRAVSLTLATMNQALACYAHAEIRDSAAGTPTDLAELIQAGGTVYVLGKDDPYASVAPLVTAICENVLDTAEALAADPTVSPHRRLDPPFLACLDEAPTICPLPSLAQRVNDGRGRGIAILYAAQSWSSVKARWGHDPAAALGDATSNLVVYGGCKDPDFLADLERLCGQHKVTRRARTRTGDGLLTGGPVSTSASQHWEPVLRAHQIGQLPVGQALLLAENCPPVIARQRAVFEDKRTWQLIRAEQATAACGAEEGT